MKSVISVFAWLFLSVLSGAEMTAFAQGNDPNARIIYVKPGGPREIIIDNDGAGTSSSGDWELRELYRYYGGTLRVSPEGGGQGDSYTFQTSLNGTAQVSFMWYRNSTWGSDEVSVEISDGNSLLNTIVVNQRHNGSIWNDMGTYDFRGTAKVVITKGDIMRASVDAVKFTFSGQAGSSWDLPFDNLNDALADAVDGNEVWVAAGTYVPGSTAQDTFELKPGVAVYGGFAGDETERGQRDWIVNETILDGGGVCAHVVTATDGSLVDGFTIAGGNNDSNGAGMYINGGSANVKNCAFADNSAGISGGAIFVDIGAGAAISQCDFVANEAAFGGAIYCDPCSVVTIENCIFAENIASLGGGAMCQNVSADLTVADCLFTWNVSDGNGGAIWLGGAGSVVSNCLVSGNAAYDGGGIFCGEGSVPKIKNCTISSNSAGGKGGGIMCYSDCDATISNCILWSNTAGEGLQIGMEKPLGPGPTVMISYSDVQGGLSGIHGDSSVSWGPGNIDADPEFAPVHSFVSHWKLDEDNNSVAYDSVGQNDGTVDGAQWTSGWFGGALHFDGTDDYVEVADDNSLNITDKLTLAAWIKVWGDGIGNGVIAFKGTGTTATPGGNDGSYGLVYLAAPDKLSISLNVGGWADHLSADTVSTDTWYHVAGTYDGSAWKLYLDGALNNSGSLPGSITTQSGSLFIGYENSWQLECFYGLIDDVHIYSEALFPEEIEQLYLFGSATYDFHLQSSSGRWDPQSETWVQDLQTSPCIDAGNPGCPLGDEPKDANNVRINMGAYGGTAEASMPPYDWAILGDITNDGILNFVDFAYQAEDWQVVADERPGDFDRSGTVDINDVALSINDWLKTTTWHD